MRKVRVAPKGMGLNDFVAERQGFFAAEGIGVEWGQRLLPAAAGQALHGGR